MIEEFNKYKSYIYLYKTQTRTPFLFVLFLFCMFKKYILVDKETFSVGIDWGYPDTDGYKDVDDECKMKPRYNSLKEEMLNYNYLSNNNINQIVNKATQYRKGSTIKSSTFLKIIQ